MAYKKEKKVKIYKKKKKNLIESEIIKDLQDKYNKINELKLKKFTDLPLSIKTYLGLKESKYIDLTDIQRQSIGLALKGKDILGAAKTGSGKTLAFLIPVIEILYCHQWTQLDGIGALIITPTRELAYQIYETLRKVGKYHNLSAGLIIGGKDLHFEKKRMGQCNIIICTPGRLLQHMDENPLLDCINMKILVLDEADLCLDMGFKKTMNSIIENLSSNHQTLLFSATQTKSVQDLARLSLKDPLYVSVHENAMYTTPNDLQQSYIVCELEEKISVLWSFIRNHLNKKIIVFISSCKQVKYIFEAFCRMRPGISLLSLYGTLHQLKRMHIYESFCRKQHAVLFATDIAARGLDFPDVNWVIQLDCPEDVNGYIHRAGRTARLHNGGESLLILLPCEQNMIQKLKERKIPINMIKINLNKLYSPQRKLEAILARDVSLKESAKRAFVAYVRSVFLMKDKSIFNLDLLNTDAFARSLGLAIPPRIRFLKRNEIMNQSKEKTEKEANNISNINNISEKEETRKIEIIKENINILQNFLNDNDSVDEILSIKRKHIDVDISLKDTEYCDIKSLNLQHNKVVTKAALAKKILKKKIVSNKKINFNEEGEEVINPTKSKISDLAKQYENEEASGINIETAKQILKEEDHFDKKRFKQKIKEKHREEKKKLKVQKIARNESDLEETVEITDSYEPDLSWLPDPDKIYGKLERYDEKKENSIIKSSNSIFKNDEIHRKIKIKTQNIQNKSTKHSPSNLDNTKLQADEELALQLLRSS